MVRSTVPRWFRRWRAQCPIASCRAKGGLSMERLHGDKWPQAHNLWLPKTPSELKMQWFRAFVRSWWYQDELSFCCPFRFGRLQFSIPCRPAGGDPRASSSTRGFPEECTAAFAPPALRPAFVGLAVTMVARLAPESTHRSPRYSDRLAP